MSARGVGWGVSVVGRVWRRGGLVMVVPVVVAGLISCSPRAAGVVGVGTDGAGNLVAVTDGCGEELTFMTFRATADGGPTATAANGQLMRDESELGQYEIPDGQPRLTVIGRADQIRAGVSYSVGAWDESRSVSAGPITFRAEQIDGLRPGEILPSAIPRRTAQPPTESMTVEQWLGASCADKR